MIKTLHDLIGGDDLLKNAVGIVAVLVFVIILFGKEKQEKK